MIRHGYFATRGSDAQSDAPATHRGNLGRSATNAVYVVLVMRLLSPQLRGSCNSG
jgi:hypothetical protein